MNELPRRLLERAADRIGAGWAQRADARTAAGTATDPWASNAVCWSLLGALVAALEEEPKSDDVKLPALAEALNALAGFLDDDSLAAWNDRPTQTRENVLRTLDAAAGTL